VAHLRTQTGEEKTAQGPLAFLPRSSNPNKGNMVVNVVVVKTRHRKEEGIDRVGADFPLAGQEAGVVARELTRKGS